MWRQETRRPDRLLEALAGRVSVDADDARLAIREGLGALLGDACLRGLVQCVDDAVRMMLVAEHRRCLASEIVFERGLAWVSDQILPRSIPLILLKGAALARIVYPHAGTRPMSDLDLLVPARRWREAEATLRSAGAAIRGPRSRSLTLRHDYAIPLDVPAGVVVELHRYLSPRPLFRVDHAGLFIRARSTDRGGIYLPDETDLFLHLALHAAKHAYDVPFRSILDGLLLARTGRIDQESLRARASAWRARRALALWLHILRQYGLEEHPWQDLAHGLAPAVARASLIEHAPRRDLRGARRWTTVAAALDGMTPRVAYLAQRVGFRVIDAAVHFTRTAASLSHMVPSRRLLGLRR